MGLIVNTLKNYQFRHLNIRLIIWVIALTVLGINVISSATESSTYEYKQTLGLIMGCVVMVMLGLISYKFVLRFYWVFYFINLALNVTAHIIASDKEKITIFRLVNFKALPPNPDLRGTV